jgi:hypothetical protein
MNGKRRRRDNSARLLAECDVFRTCAIPPTRRPKASGGSGVGGCWSSRGGRLRRVAGVRGIATAKSMIPALAGVSMVIMPTLSWARRPAGRALGSISNRRLEPNPALHRPIGRPVGRAPTQQLLREVMGRSNRGDSGRRDRRRGSYPRLARYLLPHAGYHETAPAENNCDCLLRRGIVIGLDDPASEPGAVTGRRVLLPG